jgi:hypothetical protein
MKCMKARYILSIAATFGMLVSYCSLENLQMSGGTTTETTNGYVTGSLEKIDGTPARQTTVKLIESNYDPVKDGPVPDSLVETTGEAGEFAFHIAGGGTFNIEGVQRSSGESILISGVMVKDSDTTTIPPGTIRKSGSIKILLPPNIDTAGAYIYIRGTTICAMLDDTSGFALLESVPAGIIPSVYYAVTSSAAGPKTIADSVSVAPGVTTVIVYQTWAHSAKLVLNTTASGAGIAGTVTNFPVLIRLREGNFDFAQAKADGGDLRFTKSNGAPLPYEIERWDPVARQAEVWVKVDTVYGNDSTRSIMMFWGDPAATTESNGVAVFDTANGFQGVWHLNRKCDDVTYARNNGTDYGTTDTTGIIGDCQKFDGSDSIKIAGLLGSPASVTLSAWAQLDSVPGGGYGGEVLSIGDAVLIRMDFSVLGLGTYGAIHPYGDSVYYNVSSGQFLKQTGWHLITFTVDQNIHSQTLYIDGSAVRSGNGAISIDYSIVGQNTFIGTHGNGSAEYNFSGMIDEVRVYRKSISADYVKLSFMNQKELDALVKW